MPRKPVKYCSQNPYSICARSNNRDWFDVPMEYCFSVYANILEECIRRFDVQIHAFVLMNNHFHLILSTPRANIGQVLRYFMTETSRGIRRKSQRINHIYGGRNHKTLIEDSMYYAHCLKYVLRNPVKAGICERVEDYPWSTVSKQTNKVKSLVRPVETGIDENLPADKEQLLSWLNEPTPKEIEDQCMKASRRAVFEFKPIRRNQKMVDPRLGLPINAGHPQKVPGTNAINLSHLLRCFLLDMPPARLRRRALYLTQFVGIGAGHLGDQRS